MGRAGKQNAIDRKLFLCLNRCDAMCMQVLEREGGRERERERMKNEDERHYWL